MRLNRRRPTDGTQPLDSDRAGSIYDQHTVMDSNFSNRTQTRRSRQSGKGFSVQQLSAWAADPKNTRTLLIALGVVGALLALVVLFRVITNNNASAVADDSLGTAASPSASIGGLGFESDPGASGADFGSVAQPVPAVPSTDPAAQPPTTGGQFFVVTGTATEGLFLRSEPRVDPATLIGTLPEGSRVEFTGEAQNDGTREWRKVRTDLGEGWVAADFLQPAP